MAHSLQKTHWLVHVLRRAGIAGGGDLPVDPGTPSTEAWRTACGIAGLSQDELAAHVAAYFRLAVAELEEAKGTAIKLVPERIAREYGIFPLREDDQHLTVATGDPTDFAAEQTLGFISGRRAVFEVAPPPSILEAIEATYGPEATEDVSRVGADRADEEGATPAIGSARGDAGLGAEERASDPHPGRSPSEGQAPGIDASPDDGPILVVDDDPEDRLLVRTVLKKHGFEVQEAADGHEALELIGEGRRHALVVLDLEMPTVNGREVLASLRGSHSTAALPVFVLTGSPDPEDEYRLMAAGADDYLRKPLDPPRFIARVRAALRRARIV